LGADPKQTTPRAIAPTADGQAVHIVWADGHESILPLLDLRRACPCATCGDERAKLEAPSAAKASSQPAKSSALRIAKGPSISDLALARIAGVGRYAIQLFWADGHDTGIYSFELLRALCACDECRQKKNPEE
jgi:DUF971 family protein